MQPSVDCCFSSCDLSVGPFQIRHPLASKKMADPHNEDFTTVKVTAKNLLAPQFQFLVEAFGDSAEDGSSYLTQAGNLINFTLQTYGDMVLPDPARTLQSYIYRVQELFCVRAQEMNDIQETQHLFNLFIRPLMRDHHFIQDAHSSRLRELNAKEKVVDVKNHVN